MENRELDGLLAVMLFGYTWRMASYDGTRSALCPPAIYDGREVAPPNAIRAVDATRYVPYFSQRPMDALRVADKLRELKFIIDIAGDHEKWVAAFSRQEHPQNLTTYRSQFHSDVSFSRAICLAALEVATHLEYLKNQAQEKQ